MNSEEISAFAAYCSQKKSKTIDLDKKIKHKKKKKKLNNNVNVIMNNLIKAASENINGKISKKNSNGKNLIKAALKAPKESIFKDCTLTTKADNIFLQENGESDLKTDTHLDKTADAIKKPKKLKKKLLNDEKVISSVNESTTTSFKNDKIVLTKETKKANKGDSVEIDTTSLINKHKLMKLEDKMKVPNVIFSDSVKVGEEVFSWLLSPLSLKEFFDNCWEQKPLHIQHKDQNYFKCICTLEDFKTALRKNDMYFTRNIDVTSYVNGERKTENPEGMAKPAMVWDFFRNGKSIRLLNPQTFISNVRVLNSSLQEFFHCFVGANIYLTPPGTQGFAPHYDDIEAFVLQLEGEKHWKLYNPRSPEEVLPRESSRNFTEDEIGEPILEVILQPGDLLYFPRGIIHQAKCLPHIHSLHITVSCYQRNSWADLLEKVLPVALQKAINEDVELRKGLPIGYLNSLGMIYSDKDSVLRQQFIKKFEELAQKVLDLCPVDAGVDQLGATFTHDALPPSLAKSEKLYGADRNCKIDNKNVWKALKNSSEKNLRVKLIRATSVRLVSEEEEMILYYTTDNSLVYHEFEPSRIRISSQWAQAVDYLLHSYPSFVEMKQLPVSNKINKPGKWKRVVEFVYFLWQKGLLLFDQPLLEICS